MRAPASPGSPEDGLRRMQTSDEIDMRQRLGPMFCCVSVCQLVGAGLFGYLWLSSAQWVKEDDSGSGLTTSIAGDGVTTPSPASPTPLPAPGADAWSTWYHYEGYFVIGLKTLTALMMCIMFIVSKDEHAVKEEYYRQTNRNQEADAEYAQEGGCTHVLKCIQGCANCISGISQCGLCGWCCIGLLMFMGAGILGPVKGGYNDDSKWYLIIMFTSVAWDCFVVIPVICCCGGMQMLPKILEMHQRGAFEEVNQAHE